MEDKILKHPVKYLLEGCKYITEQCSCFGYENRECEIFEARTYLENILKIDVDEELY